jgi:putative DNA primase/helicase
MKDSNNINAKVVENVVGDLNVNDKNIPMQLQPNEEQVEVCAKQMKTIDKILEELLLHIKAESPAAAGELDEGISLSDKDLVVITSDFVKSVAKKHDWDIAEYQGGFIAFNGQYWVKIGTDELRDFLGKAAEKIGVKSLTAKHFIFRNSLLNQFTHSAYFKTSDLSPNETKINLCNGTYVFNKDRQYLKPYDKNDFMMYKLGFPFDESAEAPLFTKYLNEVLPVKEKQDVLAEFIGYAFIKNSVLKLEKACILLGSGANGKSVFFDIISGLLGNENMSYVSLQTLTNPGSYSKPLLADKLLNYASEISTKMDTTEFKTLISGEPIAVRQIREKSFILSNYARFMFNTNELPSDVEHNHGFFRRFLIIEFDQTIEKSKMDTDLANKIKATELSGVFNWVLAGLTRLMTQQNFSKCPQIDEAVLNFKKESDAVNLFIEDSGFKPSSSEKMPLKSLYEQFRAYCKESYYQNISNKAFSKRLKNYGYHIERLSAGRFVFIAKC